MLCAASTAADPAPGPLGQRRGAALGTERGVLPGRIGVRIVISAAVGSSPVSYPKCWQRAGSLQSGLQ